MSLKLSKIDLGKLFDVSTRTISTWQTEDGFPQPEQDGRANIYSADLVLRWWYNREIRKLIDDEDGTPLDLTAARARLAVAQTKKTTVETELKQSQLMHLLSGGVIPADRYDPLYRLRCILDEYRFMARDALREKLNTLLERYVSAGVGELEEELEEEEA